VLRSPNTGKPLTLRPILRFFRQLFSEFQSI
ncbi:uncharacterized protein METZ01_LOCUS465672, partial [marine metagenome]